MHVEPKKVTKIKKISRVSCDLKCINPKNISIIRIKNVIAYKNTALRLRLPLAFAIIYWFILR